MAIPFRRSLAVAIKNAFRRPEPKTELGKYTEAGLLQAWIREPDRSHRINAPDSSLSETPIANLANFCRLNQREFGKGEIARPAEPRVAGDARRWGRQRLARFDRRRFGSG